MRRRCRLVAAGVLAAGWTAAVAVYATAAPAVTSPDVEEARLSKAYERQMEVFGGKAAIAGAELDDWLSSLWHGRRLAYTIAVLAVPVALACWAVCVAPGGAFPGGPRRMD